MARTVETIQQDIAHIEQRVAAIAQEFRLGYQDYLQALGQTVRQQLIFASYHLCTQHYPDAFLHLSFDQRHKLQQALRNLGKQTEAQLLRLPESVQPQEPERRELFLTNESTIIFSEDLTGIAGDRSLNDFDLESDSDDDSPEPNPDESAPQAATSLEALFNVESLQPSELSRWLEGLERGIVGILQTASHGANLLLQQASILPKKLPNPVLEVAAKAGNVADGGSNVPNLLNLLIETPNDDDDESSVTHIVTIHLRLAEIEFGNATVAALRSKIRGLAARLNQIGRDYQKKQRERAIAAAEDAWRSSWYED